MNGRWAAGITIVVAAILAGVWLKDRSVSRVPIPEPHPTPASTPPLTAAPLPKPPQTPTPVPATKPSPVPAPKSQPAKPAPPSVAAPKPAVRPAKPAAPKTAPPPPQTPTHPPIVEAPPPAVPTEWQGNDTAVRRDGQVVITNDRQWIQFWGEHRPHTAAPEVDFSKSMVIGVFAGPRPADPFKITIVSLREAGGQLVIEYREDQPPPGTLAINVRVYPYHIKIVPRSSARAKFKRVT